MEMGAESALIWDLGRAFHMTPSSRLWWYRWMLLEKRVISKFCWISLQFRPKLFQMARTPSL